MWGWEFFFGWLRANKSKEMEFIDDQQNKEVAIIIGHTQNKPGACSPHGVPCEWPYNNGVAKHLEDIADIFYHDTYAYGYRSMIKRTADKINALDYKLVLELHYNAATPAANGVEALYYFANNKGKELAQHFAIVTSEAFGIKVRGNKGARALTNKNDRGFYAVYYPRPTALILEPFFGTSKSDVDKIRGKEEQYANVIRDTIRHYIDKIH